MADPAGNTQPPPYSPPEAGWTKSATGDPVYPPQPTGYPAQPAGYSPYPPQANQPMAAYPPPNTRTTVYSSGPSGAVHQTVTVQQGATTSQVVVVGTTCPRCHIGILQESFTPLGICCAIFFFPLGLLCCLMMRNRHCPSCGAIYQ